MGSENSDHYPRIILNTISHCQIQLVLFRIASVNVKGLTERIGWKSSKNPN